MFAVKTDERIFAMKITDNRIDGGKAFDWGLTSHDYAKYRDIYPKEFYEKIICRNLCTQGQNVLDLGTGTGVLPRNLYRFGANWTGTDISENQIIEAQRLAKAENMDINFKACSAEKLDFPSNSFDVITACQCFWYFDHEALVPKLWDMLKKNGRFLVMCMEWLPFEDKIAGASENLVLKYSPDWSGAGETKKPIEIPKCYFEKFDLVSHDEFDLKVPFTRESWNGRMKACRGIGASLPPEKIKMWEAEHKKLLEKIAPESFEVLHYAAIAELRVKK